MNRASGYVAIIISVVLAMIATAIPLPEWAVVWRPAWVCLVLIYWCVAVPERIGIFTAWILGLTLDVLHGAVLGQHALGLAVVAFVAVTYHQRLRVFSLFHQALFVGSLVFIYLGIMLGIYNLVGTKSYSTGYLLAAVTSGLLWPWIFVIMRDFRRRFSF